MPTCLKLNWMRKYRIKNTRGPHSPFKRKTTTKGQAELYIGNQTQGDTKEKTKKIKTERHKITMMRSQRVYYMSVLRGVFSNHPSTAAGYLHFKILAVY